MKFLPISLFKNNSSKNKLKHKINISQDEKELKITGVFNKPNYYAIELWLFSRNNAEKYKIMENNQYDEFNFYISLSKLIDILHNSTETTFDWFFKVRTPYSKLKGKQKKSNNIEVIEKNGEKYAEYFIRCGRFQHTNIKGLTYYHKNDNYFINYITKKGNLSLLYNNKPSLSIKMQIDKVKKRNSTLYVEGKIFTKSSLINKGYLVVKGRDTNTELSTSMSFDRLEKEVETKYGLNRYIYKAEIDFKKINNSKLLEEDVYDLYLKLDLHDHHEAKYIRVGRPTNRARIFLKDLFAMDKQEAIIINPYYTFKASNLSLEVTKYPLESFKFLRAVMRWSWLIQFFYRKKDVWIIGERIYKAQDTGYAFFKYMRTEHPDKDVYYVIDKNSPECANVSKYGNVLHFKSKEHIFYTILSKKVISSHHPDYLYPVRTDRFKQKVKAEKIFLQHGVMGTKNMVANYGKKAPGFDTDLFIVSSDFEKEMIVNDFGYDPKEVFVTGLSRFDTLFKQDVNKRRQILIIPTWRDWILTEKDFIESEYFNRYNNLIHNQKLIDLSRKYHFDLIFCLHPNMQKYSQYFNNNVVKIVFQGEIDVQYLIKQSALMITDYSSVGFDFSFLHKPVIYYQFDRKRFIGKRPSHLDLDNDLPGEICFDENKIIDLVQEYSENDFKMKLMYKERANKFIKYRDRNSSERIYHVVKNFQVRRSIFVSSKVLFIRKVLFKKFRKSKYYFPTMKLFYRIGSKVIPADKNLILFESGLGKQYADSPRYIYEEILNEGLDYKKVWVYNKQHRFNDPNTKRINRLSPAYYYYLLKAGYWVNNQNFPSYIRKRAETTYIQTWHGTPLKKMLYDIKEVHGRSDDYVERVGNAVKNWDYLISPSPYASKAFRSAFKYNGEIIEAGYPRNDIFYKENKEMIISRVKNKLNLDNKKKIILYAPTFRDDQTKSNNKFTFNLKMDLSQMKKHLGEEYVVLLRMHVVISNKIVIDDSLKGFVYNVSSYPDIQELLLLTDILITDYSSVMFDFVNTGRPLLFFTYDLENYRDNLRGFYLDFEEEAPGPLLFNTDEIVDSVLNIEYLKEKYQEKYKKFQQKYCPLEDGYTSKRIVEKIFKN